MRIDYRFSRKFPDLKTHYIDEWPKFLAWPFVLFFYALPFVSPGLIVLLSLIARVWAAGLIAFADLNEVKVIVAVLIALGIILDCADGMLARLKKQSSSLGALYDLSADFLSSLLLFLAVGLATQAWGWAMTALLLHFVSVSAWSFLLWRDTQDLGRKLKTFKSEFYALPEDDGSKGFNLWRKGFNWTWGASLKAAYLLPIWGDGPRERWILHFLALASLGWQLIALILVVLLPIDLLYYLYYEIGLALVIFGLIALNET